MNPTVVRLRRYNKLASLTHDRDRETLLWCWFMTVSDALYYYAHNYLYRLNHD